MQPFEARILRKILPSADEDRRIREVVREILRTLERVLARNPDHPGALHLYIHAVEAGPEPRRGETAADRLRRHPPRVPCCHP